MGLLELQVQAAGRHCMWVHGIESGSLAKAARVLKHQALAPTTLFITAAAAKALPN